MKKDKLIFTSIISLLVFYVFNRMTFIYNSIDGDILTKINISIDMTIKSIVENVFL